MEYKAYQATLLQYLPETLTDLGPRRSIATVKVILLLDTRSLQGGY